jgi:hypothetical protein
VTDVAKLILRLTKSFDQSIELLDDLRAERVKTALLANRLRRMES